MALTERLKLHDILCEVIGSTKPNKCAFSPPPSIHLEYPCIIYNKVNGYTAFADNNPYIVRERYNITLIDEDPDSEYVTKIEYLPMCKFDRAYCADGLNHFVFSIYI